MKNEFQLSLCQWSYQIKNSRGKLSFLAKLHAPYAYPHNVPQLENLECWVTFSEAENAFEPSYFRKGQVAPSRTSRKAGSIICIECSQKNIEKMHSLALLYSVKNDGNSNIFSNDLMGGLSLDVDVEIATHLVEDDVNYSIDQWEFMTTAY
jgi:hypothetical protein